MSATELAIKEAILARVLGAHKELHILPYYIGAWVDSLLMGVVISQLFTYWQFVQRDKKYIVAVVAIVGILAAAASIVIVCWTVRLFVWRFGEYTPFTELGWTTRYRYIEVSTIAVVQAFYVDRCCRLYRHWWPAVIIGPCSVVTMVMGFVSVTYMGTTFATATEAMQTDPLLRRFAYTLNSFLLITDSMITFSMAYGLWRIKTGWAHTDTALKRLFVRCFETQIPALISIVMILWNRKFEVVLGFIMIQSKIFACGLLITLNLRAGSSAASEGNVSYPATSNIKSDSSYPMGNLSSDQPHKKSEERSWDYSTDRPTDVESAHHDTRSDVDDKDFGSTTGLNSAKRG